MSDYLKVLLTLKSCPKSFQSNYVRNNAALIAEAASRGHISCLSGAGRNAGVWEVTASGIAFLAMNGAIV